MNSAEGTATEARFAGPAEFDTALAALHGQHGDIASRVHLAEEEAHRAAGDKRAHRGRRLAWEMPLADALSRAPEASARRDALLAELAGVQAGIAAMNEAYTGWSRFFPTDTKGGGHVHSSTACRTLYSTTVITWTPALSGRPVDEAVATLGPVLCQVCFPEARSEWKREPREVARERNAGVKAAADAARTAAAASRKLAGDEQFRTVYDRRLVTTVAACKQLIRDAVSSRAELAWYRSDAARENWSGDRESLERVTGNIARRLALHEQDAAAAGAVLLAREATREGHGATPEEIVKLKAGAAKRAAKDWAA